MSSKVYFGSARQAQLDARETLPAKLDLIIDQLHIRDRVKDETVVIKMHTGNNMSYSTIHPVFVRRVVQAVKDGGGKPYVVDVNWDAAFAEYRGYASEVIGCQVYPAAGPDEKYFYAHERPFKNIQRWLVAGLIQDSSFLINFAHVKGHPSCGFGAAMKNIALGCLAGETRSAMHDSMHFDQYWFPEKCPDQSTRQAIIDACPFSAVVIDKHDTNQLHLHMEQCNQCGRCLKVAPAGSLKIDPVNFHTFQEAMALAVDTVLSTFAKEKIVNLSLATHMTPVCDCFGFTSMQILPDAGVFGSDDIVAIDQAALDITGQTKLIEENLPTSMEVHTREGHPFRWLHGPHKDPYKVLEYAEKLGLGSRAYELVDVFPVEKVERSGMQYIAAH
jgi:uncharacterized protein